MQLETITLHNLKCDLTATFSGIWGEYDKKCLVSFFNQKHKSFI
jgi:hypothetical protein